MHYSWRTVEHTVGGGFAQECRSVALLAYNLVLDYCHLIYQTCFLSENVVQGQVDELAVVLFDVFVEELAGYVYSHLLGFEIIGLESYGFEPGCELLLVQSGTY